MNKTIAIVGGGAAGFFCAAILAEHIAPSQITIYERSEKILQKVKISGGGRCNVTHTVMDPDELITKYPRGSKEMRGPFNRFDSSHTIQWFKKQGVELKTETDGRMFPITDSSITIVDCLIKATLEKGVKLKTRCAINKLEQNNNVWELTTDQGIIEADKVLIATGSSQNFWNILTNCTSHTAVDPVPSLFTFNCSSPILHHLSGVSVPKADVKINDSKWAAAGPLLITHWGLSGPVILRLSAWAARWLNEKDYNFKIEVNWKPEWNKSKAFEWLIANKKSNPKKKPANLNDVPIPSRLWQNMVENTPEIGEKIMADIPNQVLDKLSELITNSTFEIDGKSTYKDEFVTAGGINLKEIDFKSFESKLHPGLYFAGEVLNIDAITGGFNFQAAWTGAYHAAMDMLQEKGQ